MVFLVNGYLYQREYVQESLGEISPEELNKILKTGSEEEILHLIKLMPKSTLNPAFIRDTLKSIVKETTNYKIREMAFSSIKSMVDSNQITIHPSKHTMIVHLTDIITGKGAAELRIKERFVSIENREETPFDVLVHTYDQTSEPLHIPIYRAIETTFSLNEPVKSPLAINLAEAPDQIVMHLTNVGQAPITELEVAASSGELGSDADIILKDNRARIERIDPSKSISLYAKDYLKDLSIEVSFLTSSETTDTIRIQCIKDVSNVMITENEIKRDLTDKTLDLEFHIQNPYGFQIEIESATLKYFSEENPNGLVFSYDRMDLEKELGTIHLNPGDSFSIKREIDFPLEEHPTFKGEVSYHIIPDISRTLEFRWTQSLSPR